MTARQTFRTPGAATHHRGPLDAAANSAERVPATAARPVQPATMAGTHRADQAPGPAAVTSRPTDQHQMSIVDHSADAAPTTDVVLTDEHHPAQPATNEWGRCSR